MLCAVLIPSRARPDRLVKTLESIYTTVSDPTEIETLIRIDDDDAATMARRSELTSFPNTRVLVGKRGLGWRSLNVMYDELVAETQADWLWIMNDDAVIDGGGWDIELRRVPKVGFLVQPEIYQLGASKYASCEGGAFPIVRNGSWKPEWDGFVDPIDTRIDDLLRNRKGWKTMFLSGVSVIHDRDSDEALAAHRQLTSKD
mgnify:FL=1